jgi:hypothetical protein
VSSQSLVFATYIPATMLYPSESSACRSPRLPGAWIEATSNISPRVLSRPYSGVSQSGDDARSFPRRRILPRVSALALPLHALHD